MKDMTHEKIFSRPDGSRIKIIVSLNIGDMRGDKINWGYTVLTCEPRKRTWKGVTNTDDYNYRRLSMDQRVEARKQEYLKFASKEEIVAAQTELWEKLKPA